VRTARSISLFARALSLASLAAVFAVLHTAALAQVRAPVDAAPVQSPVRGIVRSVDQASISTELATRVAAVHFREGEHFKTGDVLLEFDCRRQRAGLVAAEAQQLEMQLNADKFRVLQRTQSVGKNDLEVSEARLVKASAEADALRSQLDQCVVIAPYNGRVLEVTLQKYEAAQPGKPFLGIVSISNLEIDVIVPSDWVRWLKPGIAFVFHIDEIRRPVEAVIVRTGAAVDAISQTIKISAAFKGETEGVLPGMSGTAQFRPAGG
jgi:membrane fusion protein, multidrug efflux system